MTEELRAPASDADWTAYHAIRRHVLFELRGNGPAYDPNHRDEHRAGNHALIFWAGDAPVGVIRVDVRAPVATLRRVAIRAELQRRGYGRRLLQSAERFARTHGCARLQSHVDPNAVGFYERCGYARIEPAPGGATVLMEKVLGE